METSRVARAQAAVRGIKTGLIYASLYAVVAIGLRFVGEESPQSRAAISLGSAVAAYFVMGIVGGAIVGYWRVSAATAASRALLCFALGSIVSAAAIAVLLGLPWTWDAVGWISALIFSGIITAFLYARWDFFFDS